MTNNLSRKLRCLRHNAKAAKNFSRFPALLVGLANNFRNVTSIQPKGLFCIG